MRARGYNLPGMAKLFSEVVWMRLGFWAIGVAAGAVILVLVLPGSPRRDVPEAPPPRRAAPPKKAPPTPPPTRSMPEPERKARETLEAAIARHSEALRERLSVPRRGLPPHAAGKSFSARFKGSRSILGLSERQRTPYSAEVVYDIDWYCDETLVGPQEIVAAYEYKDGVWVVGDAYRRVGKEHVATSDEKSWLRNLFK